MQREKERDETEKQAAIFKQLQAKMSSGSRGLEAVADDEGDEGGGEYDEGEGEYDDEYDDEYDGENDWY